MGKYKCYKLFCRLNDLSESNANSLFKFYEFIGK